MLWMSKRKKRIINLGRKLSNLIKWVLIAKFYPWPTITLLKMKVWQRVDRLLAPNAPQLDSKRMQFVKKSSSISSNSWLVHFNIISRISENKRTMTLSIISKISQMKVEIKRGVIIIISSEGIILMLYMNRCTKINYWRRVWCSADPSSTRYGSQINSEYPRKAASPRSISSEELGYNLESKAPSLSHYWLHKIFE